MAHASTPWAQELTMAWSHDENQCPSLTGHCINSKQSRKCRLERNLQGVEMG